MAIRRCPYCKAIIDEEDKYCNNCGTQLLFPEDESIEEDIPGDKIVEEEETEEDITEKEAEGLADEEEDEEELVDEPGREELGLEEESAEAEEGEEQEEIEEERLGDFLEDASEDEKVVREEEELIEEREDEGEFEAVKSEASAEETEDEGADVSEAEREASGWPFNEESAGEDEEDKNEESEEAETEEAELEGEEEEEVEEEEIEQPPSDRFAKDEPEKKYEVSIEEDELVFKTKDLDRLTGSVEEGKRDEEERPATETKEDLPPWASGMKEIPSSSIQEEETEGEETTGRREWTTDSGVGFPERLTQNTLPFSDTSAQRIEEERVEEEAEKPEAGERTPALSSRLRAKLVDVVFITALWLISLWFTAQVIGVSFFRLIFGSLVPVLAFYLILLILYFFLFLYFLGETLGDHYFSEED